MNLSLCRCLVFAAATVFASGCGKNINDSSAGKINPPQNLQALSVNDTTVALQWSAPGSDSTVAGYIVQFGTLRDTLPKTQLTFNASPLGRGQTLFQVFSQSSDGGRSDAATIQWATASRFDNPFVIFQSDNATPDKIAGLHVGDRLTDPATMALNDAAAATTMDLWLYEQVDQTLVLRSANLFVGTWNHTLFSTQTDPASSLDHFSPSFPASDSFTLDNVAVSDNTIYYAQVTGQPGEKNMVRLQVHDLGGNTPNRSVGIRISLQRLPGLLYAATLPVDGRESRGPIAMLFLLR